MQKLMILPAQDAKAIRLIQIPESFDERSAYRHVVGIIARFQEKGTDYTWEQIRDELEDQQFTAVDFILGPHLDGS